MKQIFIDLLAFTTLFSSLLVITSKNPVIAVVFLISVFMNAAGYLIITGINFLGISYILLYVGAITVLFLFVIMLLNIQLEEIVEVGPQYTKNLPLAFTISFLFIYELIHILPFTLNDIYFLSYFLNLITNFNSIFFSSVNYILFNNEINIVLNPIIADSAIISFTQIEAVGHIIYTYDSILLFITSIILLLAMIGPIFLHVKQNYLTKNY